MASMRCTPKTKTSSITSLFTMKITRCRRSQKALTKASFVACTCFEAHQRATGQSFDSLVLAQSWSKCSMQSRSSRRMACVLKSTQQLPTVNCAEKEWHATVTIDFIQQKMRSSLGLSKCSARQACLSLPFPITWQQCQT